MRAYLIILKFLPIKFVSQGVIIMSEGKPDILLDRLSKKIKQDFPNINQKEHDKRLQIAGLFLSTSVEKECMKNKNKKDYLS